MRLSRDAAVMRVNCQRDSDHAIMVDRGDYHHGVADDLLIPMKEQQILGAT
ncbi:MAG: hypothetical protein RI601_08800 [Desulfurivibrionaceae bacterium]|nr:hypothetical protein [Desulfurivibrionaceae bacterium]